VTLPRTASGRDKPVRARSNGNGRDTSETRGPGRGGAPNVEAGRNLHALEAIADNDHITQRALANRLGIALGLANIYLKRLVRKGYVKCVHIQSNRLRYLLTPKGIAEKTRLTYEFMQYSLDLYGQVRLQLRTMLEPYAIENRKRVAVYGTGEAAELTYLSVTELGLELVAVFDGTGGGKFLGQPVRHIDTHHQIAFDLLLIASLDHSEPLVERLVELGIDRERVARVICCFQVCNEVCN
jgi:DNA-binding MarR family transcriptional regulator